MGRTGEHGLKSHSFLKSLGDFNQTLNPEDSSQVSIRISGGMKDFRKCILASELRDLVFKGHSHTWWNKSEEAYLTKKLDRVLVNDD